jgi:vacuolar-type H+-ATPase subunit E/Vma4
MWQMIIDAQRGEIARIEKEISDSEKSLTEDDENIRIMSRKYKMAQSQNEATLNRCRRKTDLAVQRRVELQALLKHALSNVSSTTAEILKNQDMVEEYRAYRAFMTEVTPPGETTNSYFDVPQTMVGCLDGIEQGNLMLVQAVHYYTEKLEKAISNVEEAASSEEIARKVDIQMQELADIIGNPASITEGTLNRGRFQESEYEKLKCLIAEAYGKCLVQTGDIGPLGMLVRLENQLEEFYKLIDQISPAFVTMKRVQQDKARRELQRHLKQKRQEAEQKIKMEQALYRATRPIQKRT